jgi:hypothetical protein
MRYFYSTLRRGPCAFALVLGLSTLLSVEYAQAQTTTTTTVTITGVCGGPPGFCPVGGSATALGANTSDIAASAVNSEVESNIEDIRKRRLQAYGGGSWVPLGFASDPELDNVVDALGYAPVYKNPLYVKAQPADNGIQAATWAQGSYGGENQSGRFNGADIGAVSTIWGGLGGVDFTKRLSPQTLLTVGVFGGDSNTFMSVPTGATATTQTGIAGAYLMYFSGNFSNDLTYTSGWMHNSGTDVSTSFATTVLGPSGNPASATAAIISTFSSARADISLMESVEDNVHYRFDLQSKWWIEPTAGLVWTHDVESAGLQDMNVLRLKAGTQAGTSLDWGGVRVDPTFTALAYSDVSVTGGFVSGTTPIVTDQGQIWGKGIAKLNFVWSKNFSSGISGELYGTNGTETVIGYKGVVDLRYAW